jgi:hypothetical protein
VQAIVFGLVSVGFLAVVASMFEKFDARTALSTKTSMASTVLMLWSGVVVYAIAFVAALALADGGSLTCTEAAQTDCIVESAWEDYVVLLGAPGAAAAIAKSRGVDSPADLSEDTQATNQVTEVQYFVFNVIAMAVVIGGLWRYGRLGEVPDLLLGLSGASALTYALVKRLPPAGTAPDGLA